MGKKNVALCVPSGKFVDFSFFKSFANSLGQLMLTYNIAVFTVASPMIFENRNEILRRAFSFEEKTPGFSFDYLLWIDNDIVFNFSQVKKLVDYLDEKDFISGTYFNPLDGGIRPVAYFKNGDRYKWLEENELNGLMEVDAVGFGLLCFQNGFS